MIVIKMRVNEYFMNPTAFDSNESKLGFTSSCFLVQSNSKVTVRKHYRNVVGA
jgi:hypothetical protein